MDVPTGAPAYVRRNEWPVKLPCHRPGPSNLGTLHRGCVILAAGGRSVNPLVPPAFEAVLPENLLRCQQPKPCVNAGLAQADRTSRAGGRLYPCETRPSSARIHGWARITLPSAENPWRSITTYHGKIMRS